MTCSLPYDMLRTNRGQGPMGKIPRNLGKYMLFTWHAPQRLRPRAFLQAHIHRGIVPSCNEIYSPRWLISIHTVQGYLGKSPARWGFFFHLFFSPKQKKPHPCGFSQVSWLLKILMKSRCVKDTILKAFRPFYLGLLERYSPATRCR